MPETVTRTRLTEAQMRAVCAHTDASTDSSALLSGTVRALFNILLSPSGRTWADFGESNRLDPQAFAIPANQWQAITGAVMDRAAEWGTGAELSMELINYMPGTYQDDDAPIPDRPTIDRRPYQHVLTVTREATDVITRCSERVADIGRAYGYESRWYQEAAQTWQSRLSGLFGMGSGAETTVSRDGELSLYVSTSGYNYALIFHRIDRRCTLPGCDAWINDDGTARAYSTRTVADHEHAPSYPLDGPVPGSWAFHS